MGITIDLGLSRYYSLDHASWTKALDALVEAKLTKLVRDVIPGPKPKRGKPELRVYEAKRTGKKVVGRWLSSAEAKPIVTEWRSVEKVGGSANWSFDDFENLNVECQELELVYDNDLALCPNRVAFPGGTEVMCADLAKSTRQWSDWDREAAIVCMMHDIATRHRLVVHCA